MSLAATLRFGIAAWLLLGVSGLRAAAAEQAGKPIDVVICLDVSGSMQGLLQSARTRLWDVINDLAKIQPTPNLRVGLYSYGSNKYDAKAGWVRQEVDLTTDLDEIYKKLNALTISTGGGGSKELVARVCRDALVQQKWSAEKDALKIVFVCGNEPADQDTEVTLKSVAEKAVARDVVINTIFCGSGNHADAAGWRDFSTLAKGQSASIEQNQGPVVIAAPQDKELAELSAKLSSTYVAYGKAGQAKAENQKLQDQNALQQGKEVAAARAATKATGFYRNGAWDLVDRLKEDPKFDIKKVPDEEFCDTLKKLKPEEREAYVRKKLAERDEMQKQIADLNARRQAYLTEEAKKHASSGDRAFDAAVKKVLREQAAAKGIKVPE
jgi:hypothetical protein